MIKISKLINTTTAAERSYFSRVTMRHAASDSVLLKPLYDGLLNGLPEERLLKQIFKGKKNLYAFYLNKLQYLLLDSLVQYEGDKFFEGAFNKLLARSFVLKQKGFLKEARSLLRKAGALAEAAERYDLMLGVLNHEINLEQGVIVDTASFRRKKEINLRRKEILKKADNQRRYNYLFDRISYLRSRSTNFSYSGMELRPRIMKLYDSPLLQDKERALSFESVCLFHLCKASLYTALRQVKNSREEYRSLIIHIGSSERHLPFYKTKMRYALNQFLNTCFSLKDFADFDFYFRKLEELKAGLKNADLARHWLIAVNLRLNKNFALDNPQENVPVLKEAEKEFSLHARHLDVRYFSAYFANAAITFFHLRQFKKALPFINNILNAEDGTFNAGVYSMMKLLNMAVHTELKNRELINSLVRAEFSTAGNKLFHNMVHRVALILFELGKKVPDKALIKKTMAELEVPGPERKLMEDCYFHSWLWARVLGAGIER